MSTYTSTIELEGASTTDYEALLKDLKRDATAQNQLINISKKTVNEKVDLHWSGQVNIQTVASAISQVARATGRKYNFSIIKNK